MEEIALDDEVLTLTLAAIAPEACCPVCATPSPRLHSHYHRQATARPWGSLTVRLSLWVRRFRCGTSTCPRRIVTERLPHLLGPDARRTIRAQEVMRAIALALGGEGGARLTTHLREWQNITLPDAADQVPPVRRSQHEQAARQAGRRQRRERYDQVRALHAQGLSQLRIARQLRM